MRPAVLYFRLSQERDSSTSIERQRDDCLAYARIKDYLVVHETVDDGISGYSGKHRPGLAEALASVPSGGVLLVWKLDRLTRSLTGFSDILRACTERDVSIVSVMESFDLGTPSGKAMASIMATFAEYESASTGLRVSSAKQHLVRSGFFPGGNLPYGYTPLKVEGGHSRLVPHPVESVAVAGMVRMYLAGLSGGAIRDWLNAEGYRTKRGHLWKEPWVYRTLKHPVLGGYLTAKDGTLFKGGVDAILCETEFEALQSEIARRSLPKQQGANAPKQLWSGLVQCGCGGRLGSNGYSRKGTLMRARCRGCGVSVPPGLLVAAIEEWVAGHGQLEVFGTVSGFRAPDDSPLAVLVGIAAESAEALPEELVAAIRSHAQDAYQKPSTGLVGPSEGHLGDLWQQAAMDPVTETATKRALLQKAGVYLLVNENKATPKGGPVITVTY